MNQLKREECLEILTLECLTHRRGLLVLNVQIKFENWYDLIGCLN